MAMIKRDWKLKITQIGDKQKSLGLGLVLVLPAKRFFSAEAFKHIFIFYTSIQPTKNGVFSLLYFIFPRIQYMWNIFANKICSMFHQSHPNVFFFRTESTYTYLFLKKLAFKSS